MYKFHTHSFIRLLLVDESGSLVSCLISEPPSVLQGGDIRCIILLSCCFVKTMLPCETGCYIL